MKSLIYYIIPLLIITSTVLGRLYSWWICLIHLDAFIWIINTDEPVTLKSTLGTAIFILSIFLVFGYLLFMRRKHKRGKVYSFMEKVLVVVAIAFFIEITINGLLLLTDFALAVGYGLTYFFTVPLALFVSYFWIVINAETTIEERE